MHSRIAPMVVAAVLSVACSTHTEPGERTTMVDTVQAPWTVNYSDGSGNRYRFQQDLDGTPAWQFDPVTPQMSSSGTYSGGQPARGTLASEDVATLWRHVRSLEQDEAGHAPSRMMGTGSFRVVSPTGERSFIVRQGSSLEAFHAFASGVATAGSETAP